MSTVIENSPFTVDFAEDQGFFLSMKAFHHGLDRSNLLFSQEAVIFYVFTFALCLKTVTN